MDGFSLLDSLLNGYVLLYLIIVILFHVLYALGGWYNNKRRERNRAACNLPPNVIMDRSKRLETIRYEALIQSAILLSVILITPFGLAWCAARFSPSESVEGLAVVFVGLLLWCVLSGTEVLKSFLTGLALKLIYSFYTPIQVGDRVTLKGYSGKVTNIGVFFVTLQTLDDDLISIPTASLWSEILTSANAGDRASLCKMTFYLSSFATQEQVQIAEDAVWDAMQSSTYIDPTKPLQIFFSQSIESIDLIAKAYVASTYNEPHFKSEITKSFLATAFEKNVPIGGSSTRKQLESEKSEAYADPQQAE